MSHAAMMKRVEAEMSTWTNGLAGAWPPPKLTKDIRNVAKALCRAGCQPGLWQPDEIEIHVRRNWKRHIWPASVAIHAMRVPKRHTP